MRRGIITTKLTSRITDLIEEIYVTLKTQYRHYLKNNRKGPYPNIKALEVGFELLVIDRKIGAPSLSFNNNYIGRIEFIDNEISIENSIANDLGKGVIISRRVTMRLDTFLLDIANADDKQEYSLERILFTFET